MLNTAPWAASDYSYAGWVPNVGSHLSFSLIGSGQGPCVTHITQGFNGRIGRWVAALQRRETDDFLTWKWLTRLIWPDVVQHWLLVGSTHPVETHVGIKTCPSDGAKVDVALDEQGALLGSVYMLPRRTVHRVADKWMLAELRGLLKCKKGRSDKELDALRDDLDQTVRWRAPGALRIEFALMRTGELRLWFEKDVLTHCTDNEKLWVHARQAYFFIKDIVHDHTHHDPSSDQITPLAQVGTAPARRLDGEAKWRRETVWSLSRAVEKLVRAGRLIDLRQAMGILAYSDAFQKTLLPYIRGKDNPLAFELNGKVYAYDYAHIKESTRVLIEQAQAKRTHGTTVRIAALASSIAALSMLSSLVSTHNSRIDKPVDGGPREGLIELGIPHEWLKSLAEMPLQVVMYVWVAVALISFIATDDGEQLLRRAPRKLGQAARGLSLSIARRLGWRARGAYCLLIGIYASMIAFLTGFIVTAPAVFDWMLRS